MKKKIFKVLTIQIIRLENVYFSFSSDIYSFNVIHQNTKIIEIDEEPYEKILKKSIKLHFS